MSSAPSRQSPPVQAVARALNLLKAFTEGDGELSVTELSRRLELPKSTVSRLLATLEREDFVARNPETGRYRLGVGILALVQHVTAYGNVRDLARPHLRWLVDQVRETATLAVLDGRDAINVDQVVAPGRLILRVGWVGRRMPAHAVSSGKAILAFLPEEELDYCLEPPLASMTAYTQTDPVTLRRELEAIRREGYAVALQELEEGLHAMAAPIFNHEGRPIASVGISGPASRLTREWMEAHVASLVRAAWEISRGLGFDPERHPLPEGWSTVLEGAGKAGGK